MKIQTQLFCLLALSLFLSSCRSQVWSIKSASTTAIAIDKSTNSGADSAYIRFLEPIKEIIDKKMNVVVGKTDVAMSAYAPESELTNLSADVYRKAAAEFIHQPVDIAIVNKGGLRSSIPAGDITVRKVFEVMPFENELVVVWIKGTTLRQLLDAIAAVGGQGISGVKMEIRNKKACNISINGAAPEPNKLYCIATNDYLAAGNDDMTPLTMQEKHINTGLKVRDVFMQYIIDETKKGRIIHAQCEGRISIGM